MPFNKNVADPRIAVFGHRALAAGLPRRVFAWTEAGAGGNFSPVFEAVPVENFAAEFFHTQCAEYLASAAAFTGLAEFFAECVVAFLDFHCDVAPVSNLSGQWGG